MLATTEGQQRVVKPILPLKLVKISPILLGFSSIQRRPEVEDALRGRLLDHARRQRTNTGKLDRPRGSASTDDAYWKSFDR
jgi:hypothetical protein